MEEIEATLNVEPMVLELPEATYLCGDPPVVKFDKGLSQDGEVGGMPLEELEKPGRCWEDEAVATVVLVVALVGSDRSRVNFADVGFFVLFVTFGKRGDAPVREESYPICELVAAVLGRDVEVRGPSVYVAYVPFWLVFGGEQVVVVDEASFEELEPFVSECIFFFSILDGLYEPDGDAGRCFKVELCVGEDRTC
jgi:hypothetical protein